MRKYYSSSDSDSDDDSDSSNSSVSSSHPRNKDRQRENIRVFGPPPLPPPPPPPPPTEALVWNGHCFAPQPPPSVCNPPVQTEQHILSTPASPTARTCDDVEKSLPTTATVFLSALLFLVLQTDILQPNPPAYSESNKNIRKLSKAPSYPYPAALLSKVIKAPPKTCVIGSQESRGTDEKREAAKSNVPMKDSQTRR